MSKGCKCGFMLTESDYTSIYSQHSENQARIKMFVFNWRTTFTFNHLADAFIQSDVQMRRTIEAIRPSREQQYTSAMTSLS